MGPETLFCLLRPLYQALNREKVIPLVAVLHRQPEASTWFRRKVTSNPTTVHTGSSLLHTLRSI